MFDTRRTLLSLPAVHGRSHVAEVFQDDFQFGQRWALGVALLHHSAQFFKISGKSHLKHTAERQSKATDRRRGVEGFGGEVQPRAELCLTPTNQPLFLVHVTSARLTRAHVIKLTTVLAAVNCMPSCDQSVQRSYVRLPLSRELRAPPPTATTTARNMPRQRDSHNVAH